MVFSTKQEDIQQICDSFIGYIRNLESTIYSDAIVNILAHIQLYDSQNASNNYAVALGSVKELYRRAQMKLTAWMDSPDSLAEYTAALKSGDAAVEKVKDVDRCIVASVHSIGDALDDLVSGFINEGKLRTTRRDTIILELKVMKTMYYNERTDFLAEVEKRSSSNNVLWNSLRIPIDIVFEYYAHSLAAINAILQSVGMPEQYEYKPEPAASKTSVFGSQPSTEKSDEIIDFFDQCRDLIDNLPPAMYEQLKHDLGHLMIKYGLNAIASL